MATKHFAYEPRLLRSPLLFVALSTTALSSFATGNNDVAEEKPGSCSHTAHDAFQACEYAVGSDFWIAVGNCDNLPADADRKACKNSAKEERTSGKEDCTAQFKSRQEVCAALGEQPYQPAINPADFLDRRGIVANPNPYFPLKPGTTLVYKSGTETDTVTVTNQTKEILGVTTIAVHDIVTAKGQVTEDTVDWYAQDVAGNVWYFGEISQEFKDGDLVSLEGSWKAGVNGAQPGIIMKAASQVGDVYRQEFALGKAEDLAKVLNLTGSANVLAASCDGTCVVTRDFTPLEPDVRERKFYAPGIGSILEVNPDTGERLELVEIRSP